MSGFALWFLIYFSLAILVCTAMFVHVLWLTWQDHQKEKPRKQLRGTNNG